MTDLTAEFEAAAEQATKLSKRPDDQTLLKIYALYKQATLGDVSGEQPGFMDFVARAKFDAWAELSGMPSTQAQQGYIELIAALKQE